MEKKSLPNRETTLGTNGILGCVLAGGLSRRMGGGDKTLLSLGGKPMLSRIVERLGGQVDDVVINANGDPQRLAGLGLTVIPDKMEGHIGPLAGILAGLRHARRKGCEWLVTVAGDTPFFPDDLVERLAGEANRNEIGVAASNGRMHPVFGLWPVQLADDLEAWLEDGENRRVSAWIERHPHRRVDFPLLDIGGREIDPFFNVNTPEDLEKARWISERLGVT